eukprot:TRINITY_DN3244_c0_g1_i2.p1 TRINITY_DN3244_c0_g1~~TRINITY_DN3244_c0_g1_i2.p1  ORF type:complete len:559 (-),score=107.11 TRINITY_DN3244_c0_g1_i2:209-1759(-)
MSRSGSQASQIIVDEALLPGSRLTQSTQKSFALKHADRTRGGMSPGQVQRAFFAKGKMSRTTSLPAFEPARLPDLPEEGSKHLEEEVPDKIVSRRGKFSVLPHAASAQQALRKLASLESIASTSASSSADTGHRPSLAEVGGTHANKALSSDTSPEKPPDYLMPRAIEVLDFWAAIQYFDVFDSRKRGYLDKEAFFNMLFGITRDKGDPMTRERSDAIFAEIDLDDGGTLDKEEFLGWVFQTSSNYVGNVRSKLQQLDAFKIGEVFRKIDSDHNGVIEPDEFWEFVNDYSPLPMTREESDELHSFIDKDNSGDVDLEEFINWVFPGRELRLLLGKKDRETGYDRWEKHKKSGKQESVEEEIRAKRDVPTWETPKATKEEVEDKFCDKAIMEGKPREAVVIEITMSKSFQATFEAMKKQLRQVFGTTQVKFEVVYETERHIGCTCQKVYAKVGRGILYWDRDTMLPYQDDPFVNDDKAAKWIRDVLCTTLPDVIGAHNLRRQKRAVRLQRRKTLKAP